MEVFPLNHRAKWTKAEDKKLNDEIKSKISIEQIALNHMRTIGAIKYRIVKNIIADITKMREAKYNFNYTEPTIDDLVEISMMSKKDIIDIFKKLDFDFNICNDISFNKNKCYIVLNALTVGIIATSVIYNGVKFILR